MGSLDIVDKIECIKIRRNVEAFHLPYFGLTVNMSIECLFFLFLIRTVFCRAFKKCNTTYLALSSSDLFEINDENKTDIANSSPRNEIWMAGNCIIVCCFIVLMPCVALCSVYVSSEPHTEEGDDRWYDQEISIVASRRASV